MNILGIETSCDETAAAVVKDGRNILSNVVATSLSIHSNSGGIVPEKAAREQVKSIIPVIELALKEASLKPEDLDTIAVTVGPGLVGSLLVGVETAKALSLIWKKPIVAVNHLVAHIYANFLNTKPKFPVLSLVVSGGHTDLVLIKGHGKLTWLGGTRDDASGEAFDKCARLLGLPYPGGPSISKSAEKFLSKNPKKPLTMFPRPIINENNFDWSFSGLKTAVLREVTRKNKGVRKSELAANIQEAIVDVLVVKTLKAVKKYKPKGLLLAGGVAANKRLTEKFQEGINDLKSDLDFFVPPPALCTDNAVYIAVYAHYNNSPVPWGKIKTNPELTIVGKA